MDAQAVLAVQRPSAPVEKGTKERRPQDLFQSILSGKAIAESDKQPRRMAQDGFVIIVAAGETTARMLTTATFHILANKTTVLSKLQQELTDAMPEETDRVDLMALERLPWLTPLSMTLRDILLDPTVFEDPHEFRPERWLHASAEMEHAYVPFGRGSRMCVGLNFALAELYLGLAYLMRNLDLELHETRREADIDIVRDCFIGEASPSSKGVRVAFTRPRDQD